MRSLRILLLTVVLAASACHGGTSPTAPSLPGARENTSTTPGAPLPTNVTFTVRSGAEGLPAVSGATIRIGDTRRVTDAQGRASFDELEMPVVYTVEAPGFLSYRGRTGTARDVVTLWPWEAGMTDWWIFMTSYYGPDYNKVLWRPDRDVLLELQGVLQLEPYRSVWEHAVNQVAAAIASGGSDGPTVRLGAGSGWTPVRLTERSTCEQASWTLTPPILTPPPVVTVSSDVQARDPEAVLGMVTQLVGFMLHLSRREGPAHSGGTLSSIERTAIRMRMLRPPGTTYVDWSLEDSTISVAEGTGGYWCR